MGADLVLTPAEFFQGSLKLRPEQMVYAEMILRRFAAEGFSPQVAMGAAANAYVESKFDPNAVAFITPWTGANHQPTARENSVGLFQLNAAESAAGAGMSVAERKNPQANIARIIDVLRDVERRRGPVVTGSRDARVAAKAFCIWVENPSDSQAKGTARMLVADQLFGTLASMANPPKILTSGSFPSTFPSLPSLPGLPNRPKGRALLKGAAVSATIGVSGMVLVGLLFWLGTRGGGTMKRRQRRPWRIT